MTTKFEKELYNHDQITGTNKHFLTSGQELDFISVVQCPVKQLAEQITSAPTRL